MPRRPSFLRKGRSNRSKSLTTDPRETSGTLSDAKVTGNRSRSKSVNLNFGTTTEEECQKKTYSIDQDAVKVRENQQTEEEAVKEKSTTSSEMQQVAHEAQLSSLPAYPLSIPQLIDRPSSENHIVGVNEACEGIWKSQHPKQVALWLRHLHQALLRTRLDAYDPSEAFVSLMGAALRFHGTSGQKAVKTKTPGETDCDMETLWTVWEESMWSAAALARVCVGAAWRHQLYQRRAFLMNDRHVVEEFSGSRPHGGPRSATGTNSIISSTATTAEKGPVEEITTDQGASSDRSFSPMTSSSFGALSLGTGGSWFPPIREGLPAAMLRFAASAIKTVIPNLVLTKRGEEEEEKWLARRKSVAEAQRELVLALCYSSPAEPGSFADQPRETRWSILEAHRPIADMVHFWLVSCLENLSPRVDLPDQTTSDLKRPAGEPNKDKSTGECRVDSTLSDAQADVTTVERAKDWWYVLQVTRAVTDLISVGWRPPAVDGLARNIVYHVLRIAGEGNKLEHNQIVCAADSEAREELLTAALCSAEAVSVLAAMGSSELIPTEIQSKTVRALCSLHVSASKSSKSFDALCPLDESVSPQEREAWSLDKRTFISHKKSCCDDISDLLWVMLAQEASAAVTVSTLLDTIRSASIVLQTSVDSAGQGKPDPRESEDVVQNSAVAIQVLSGALWGKPPENPAITSIRIVWFSVLESICELAGLVTKWFVAEINGDGNVAVGYNLKISSYDEHKLLLEIISAFIRLIDSEIVGSNGFLTSDEWTLAVSFLEEILECWVGLRDTADEGSRVRAGKKWPSHERIEAKVEVLLTRLSHFLGICSSVENSSFHLLADSTCQEKLHLLLLQKAAPRMKPDDGRTLALSAVRSWTTVGFLPHRSDDWVQTAVLITAEAFSVFENADHGIYNGYLHSPLVRLEVLVSIAHDDESTSPLSSDEACLPSTSPLMLTRYVHEQHLELINRSIMPVLLQLFGKEKETELGHLERRDVKAAHWLNKSTLSSDQLKQIEEQDLMLRKAAIRLIGSLFRSATGEPRHRGVLLKMLRSVALQEAHCLETIHEHRGRFLLALEGINQLGRCLFAPFQSLPHIHKNIPDLIHSLCSILSFYADLSRNVRKSSEAHGLVLKFAALLPLARLRMSHDKRLLLVNQHHVLNHLTPSLQALLDGEMDETGVTHLSKTPTAGYALAPFVNVSDHAVEQAGLSRNDTSSVSFDRVCSAVIAALSSSHFDRKCTTDTILFDLRADECEARFRATCYDALSSFALSGVCVPAFGEFMSILSQRENKNKPYRVAEGLARCRAASYIGQHIVAAIGNKQIFLQKGDSAEEGVALVYALVEHLMLFCRSDSHLELAAGCRAVGTLVASLSFTPHFQKFNEVFGKVFESSIQRLRSTIDNLKVHEIEYSDRVCVILLSLLHTLASMKLEDSGFLSSERSYQVLEMCGEICECHYVRLDLSYRFSVRCASAVLNRMVVEDVEEWVQSRKKYESLSSLNQADQSSSAFADIFQDLLMQRRISSIRRTSSLNTSESDTVAPVLSYHESMARENDDISRFEVETHTKEGVPPKAAWFCGMSILTCRVGHTKSRYRGWIEAVLRSATSRRRALIRIPNSVSLEDPEFPSRLWDISPSGGSNGPTRTKVADSPDAEDLNTDGSEALKLARAVLSRCDSVLGPLPAGSGREDREGSFYQPARLSDVPLITAYWPSEESFVDDALACKPKMIVSRTHHDVQIPEVGSIRDWCLKVLQNNYGSLREIEQEMLRLGLPKDVLGLASKASFRIESDNLTRHLLPIQRLLNNQNVHRAISILDRITTVETHKIALLYVDETSGGSCGAELTIENSILTANGASPVFFEFAEKLGHLVLTRHLKYYSGGLDSSGDDADGKFTFMWTDATGSDGRATHMVVFHTLALMPEGINTRKRHVGNDNVHIVFVEQGCRFHELIHGEGVECDRLSASLVSGDLGFVTIFVTALPHEELVRVSVRVREGLPGDSGSRLDHLVGDDVISKSASTDYVRQVAMQADMACRAVMEDSLGPCNWEERVRLILGMSRYSTQFDTALS